MTSSAEVYKWLFTSIKLALCCVESRGEVGTLDDISAEGVTIRSKEGLPGDSSCLMSVSVMMNTSYDTPAYDSYGTSSAASLTGQGSTPYLAHSWGSNETLCSHDSASSYRGAYCSVIQHAPRSGSEPTSPEASSPTRVNFTRYNQQAGRYPPGAYYPHTEPPSPAEYSDYQGCYQQYGYYEQEKHQLHERYRCQEKYQYQERYQYPDRYSDRYTDRYPERYSERYHGKYQHQQRSSEYMHGYQTPHATVGSCSIV